MAFSKSSRFAGPWARYTSAFALEFPLLTAPIANQLGHEPSGLTLGGYVLAAVCGACLLWGRPIPTIGRFWGTHSRDTQDSEK